MINLTSKQTRSSSTRFNVVFEFYFLSYYNTYEKDVMKLAFVKYDQVFFCLDDTVSGVCEESHSDRNTPNNI